MNRRDVIRLSGCVAIAGIAGCAEFAPSPDTRLWFVRIHNGTPDSQDVSLRVNYDGEQVFERQFQDVPSFQEDPPRDDGTFAGMDSARLVAGEWNVRPGRYSIEYKLSQDEAFQQVDVGELSESQPQNVGVSMQLLGGGMNPASVSLDALAFDSETEATEFLAKVTNESN